MIDAESLIDIDPMIGGSMKELEQRAREQEQERTNAFLADLAKLREASEKGEDRFNKIMRAELERTNKERAQEQEREIEKARAQAEEEVRKRYREQYGEQEYTRTHTDKALRQVLKSALDDLP